MPGKTKAVKGSSPALHVTCPVQGCGGAIGEYCTKLGPEGQRLQQTIAHKRRRELAERLRG